MRLYFLRHTEAEDAALDDLRPLSKKGREDAARLGQHLKECNLEMDAAFASPLVRARETAEIFLKHLGSPLRVETAKAMRNEVSDQQFFRWLRELPSSDAVLLVGHEPSISRRVAALLGLGDPGPIPFPKGGLACLKTEDRQTATLKFFIAPKLLGTGASSERS